MLRRGHCAIFNTAECSKRRQTWRVWSLKVQSVFDPSGTPSTVFPSIIVIQCSLKSTDRRRLQHSLVQPLSTWVVYVIDVLEWREGYRHLCFFYSCSDKAVHARLTMYLGPLNKTDCIGSPSICANPQPLWLSLRLSTSLHTNYSTSDIFSLLTYPISHHHHHHHHLSHLTS